MIFSQDNFDNNVYLFRLSQESDNGLFIEKEGSGYKVLKENDVINYSYNENLLENNRPSFSNPINMYIL